MSRKGAEKLFTQITRYKYVLLVVALGVFLMLLPAKGSDAKSDAPASVQGFDREAEQREMEKILSGIEGAGKLELMLTVRGSGAYELARDETLSQKQSDEKGEYSSASEAVVLGSGSSASVVVTNTRYPDYIGALIVCEGGGSATVRLQLTQAVSALTGLSSDRISVIKGRP